MYRRTDEHGRSERFQSVSQARNSNCATDVDQVDPNSHKVTTGTGKAAVYVEDSDYDRPAQCRRQQDRVAQEGIGGLYCHYVETCPFPQVNLDAMPLIEFTSSESPSVFLSRRSGRLTTLISPNLHKESASCRQSTSD